MSTFVLFSGFIKPILWLLPLFVIAAILKLPAVKGWIGEQHVIRRGKKMLSPAVYHAFHNVTLRAADGTTQIDHVYVSVFGIFVIETKNMTGWIFGREQDPQWKQAIFKYKSYFQNPLHQNVRHVKALEALLQLPASRFHSLVVFTGDATLKNNPPISVCTLDQFDTRIRAFQTPLLTPQDVADGCTKIAAARLAPTLATRRAHVADLQRRHGLPATRSAGGIRQSLGAGLGIVLLKLAFGLIIFLILTDQIQTVVRSLQPSQSAGSIRNTSSRSGLPIPARASDAGVMPAMKAPRGNAPVVIDHLSGTTVEEGRAGMPAYRPPTAAEQRESTRKADEAIRLLEDNTPEM